MSEEAPNLGRRSLLATVGLAVAAAAAAALASFAAPALAPSMDPRAPAQPPPDPPPAPEVLALFGDAIARTRRVGEIRITRISGVVDGAIRVELTPEGGAPFQIEILRRDPEGPQGVADTPSMSLYLMGAAGAPTPEEVAQAIQALARQLATEEARGVKAPALRSMREREGGRR